LLVSHNKFRCTGAELIQSDLSAVSIYVYPCHNDVPVGSRPFDLYRCHRISVTTEAKAST